MKEFHLYLRQSWPFVNIYVLQSCIAYTLVNGIHLSLGAQIHRTASYIRLVLYLSEHGEWNLIDTKATVESATREKFSFSRLKFSITIRRRPLFHLLNTLFPVILMAFLTVIVFKLPPESGERIGLSLTILLAFAVYLTLISESIPQTSMSASLLCKLGFVCVNSQTMTFCQT